MHISQSYHKRFHTGFRFSVCGLQIHLHFLYVTWISLVLFVSTFVFPIADSTIIEYCEINTDTCYAIIMWSFGNTNPTISRHFHLNPVHIGQIRPNHMMYARIPWKLLSIWNSILLNLHLIKSNSFIVQWSIPLKKTHPSCSQQ